MDTPFNYSPSKWVPFRDQTVLEKVRNIKTEDLTKHDNPKLNIRIVKDDEAEFIFITDMFFRIKKAADTNQKLILIYFF